MTPPGKCPRCGAVVRKLLYPEVEYRCGTKYDHTEGIGWLASTEWDKLCRLRDYTNTTAELRDAFSRGAQAQKSTIVQGLRDGGNILTARFASDIPEPEYIDG